MTDSIVVLTTLPVDHDADALARTLVEERLAACVSLLPPMKSIYRWKNAVESADERQVVIKTDRARIDDLQTRLHQLHPYDIPEFIVLPITRGSPEYLAWLSESTSK